METKEEMALYSFHETMRNAYNILARKTEGERPLRSSFKTDLEVIVCEGLDWIHLAQDKVQWLILLHMEIYSFNFTFCISTTPMGLQLLSKSTDMCGKYWFIFRIRVRNFQDHIQWCLLKETVPDVIDTYPYKLNSNKSAVQNDVHQLLIVCSLKSWMYLFILSRVWSVTTDGFWVYDRIY